VVFAPPSRLGVVGLLQAWLASISPASDFWIRQNSFPSGSAMIRQCSCIRDLVLNHRLVRLPILGRCHRCSERTPSPPYAPADATICGHY
jgi:hypothetical protein